MSMFDQTKQAFVLENAQFLRFRTVLEREIPDAYAFLSDLYERVPATESAMERRGPAGSIRDDDRATIHEWEGDAREAQRTLRSAATAAPPSTWTEIRKKLPTPLQRLIDRFTGTSA